MLCDYGVVGLKGIGEISIGTIAISRRVDHAGAIGR